MKRRMSAVGLAVVAVLGGVALVRGAEQEPPKIEPKADQCLKAMSSYLAGLKTYSFQVEESLTTCWMTVRKFSWATSGI